MSDPIDLGEDAGFVTLKMAGVDVSLDILQTHERLGVIYDQHKNKPDSREQVSRGVMQLITSLGYPPVSHLLAHNFIGIINRLAGEALGEVKKNASGAGESPSSTASTRES